MAGTAAGALAIAFAFAGPTCVETVRGEAAVATAAGAACADAALAFATHSFLRPEEEARAGGSAADPDALDAVVPWAALRTL